MVLITQNCEISNQLNVSLCPDNKMMNIKQSVLMVIGHPHSAGFPGLQAWPARPNSHFNLQMVYYWLLAHDEHVMYFIQKIVLFFVLSGSISTFPTHLSAKHSPCLWAQSGVVAVKTFPENHRMSPIESSRRNWKLLKCVPHVSHQSTFSKSLEVY